MNLGPFLSYVFHHPIDCVCLWLTLALLLSFASNSVTIVKKARKKKSKTDSKGTPT
jgi:hypothetical protein